MVIHSLSTINSEFTVLFCSGCICVKNYNEERGLILAVNNGGCRLTESKLFM